MIRNIITLVALLLLASCDIGNASKPTDPNQSFTLARLKSTKPGTIFSAQLTGHDSKGVNYTGSVSVANRAQTMLNDVLVTQQDFILNISGGGTSMTFAGTSYVDTNGNTISSVMHTTGRTCAPVAPYAMPETVKIGDFGFLPEVACSDNTTQVQNWRVEDARNGNINVIYNVTVKNQFNTIVSVADVTLTINGSSNIVSCKIVATQPAINYKITLTVNKIHNNVPNTESPASTTHVGDSFTGIGLVIIAKDQKIITDKVFPNTPASRVGVTPGAVIMKIDDKSTDGMQVEDCVNMIRGPVGSKVKLELFFPVNKMTITFEIPRDIIKESESALDV